MNKPTKTYHIGIIGLGVMGKNLLLNIADQGFSALGYDRTPDKVHDLLSETQSKLIYATSDQKIFVKLLQKPRCLLMLVPAGRPVDQVIESLLPHLEPGDILIDAGNSHFTDTNRRQAELAAQGFHLLGVGVSGGEEGARHGPSIMPGGAKEAYKTVAPIFEKIAAKASGEPCVTYLGIGSAGHYVKMVHNGIEYAIMQLIAETYDLLKRGYGFNNDQLHALFDEWNQGDLNSYLIEITANIFAKKDPASKKDLIDEILPVAKQKGTGQWTSQSALELQSPVPTIDIAVNMRDISALTDAREKLAKYYHAINGTSHDNEALSLKDITETLKGALYLSMLIAYAQGMTLLTTADQAYHYQLHLKSVAKIWRGGCIIRAKLLEKIAEAYEKEQTLYSLLMDKSLGEIVLKEHQQLRKIVTMSAESKIPMPAFMATLSYLDAMIHDWLPANLIQAQRDYFGSHTYERIDEKGVFHTDWENTTT